jgi:hypothetical protein
MKKTIDMDDLFIAYEEVEEHFYEFSEVLHNGDTSGKVVLARFMLLDSAFNKMKELINV